MRSLSLASSVALAAIGLHAAAASAVEPLRVARWQADGTLAAPTLLPIANERPVPLDASVGGVRVALLDLGTPAQRDAQRLAKSANAIIEWMDSPVVLVVPNGSSADTAQDLATRLNRHPAAVRRYRSLSHARLGIDYLVAEPWLARTDADGLQLRTHAEAHPVHVVLDAMTGLDAHTPTLLLRSTPTASLPQDIGQEGFFEATIDARKGAYTALSGGVAYPAERVFANAALLVGSERLVSEAAHLNLGYAPAFTLDPSAPIGFSSRDPLVVTWTPGGAMPAPMQPKSASADLKLDVELMTQPPLAIGETFDYQFRVRNLGTDDSANVTLTTQIDPELIFNSVTAPAGWTCPIQPAPGGSGNITCATPLLATGADELITLSLTVPMTMSSSSETGLSGEIASAATPDPNPDNNYAEDVTVVFSFANLRMALDSTPKPVVQGDLITYTYTVINDGPDPAVGVDMTGLLPPSLEFQSITPGAGWTCPTVPALDGHGALACHRDLMPVGSETITLVARVAESAINGHEITIGAAVQTTLSEEDNYDNNAAEDSNYIREREANLLLTGPSQPFVLDRGEEISLPFLVGNNGIDAGKNMVFSFPLPVGTSFVTAATPNGWTCALPAVGAAGTVECTHPGFPVGNEAAFEVRVKIDADRHNQSLVGTATVASDWFDPATENNSANVVLNVRPLADLSIAMTAPNLARPGDAIAIAIDVGNLGPDAVASAQVDLVLPTDLHYQSIDLPAGWTCPVLPAIGTGGSLRCQGNDLPEAANDSLVVHAELSATAADQAALTATATLSSDGTATESAPANNTASSMTLVNAYKADLSVDLQTTTPNIASPGQIELNLYYVNMAGDTAHDAGVRIHLPEGTSFLSFGSGDTLLACEAPSAEAPDQVVCKRTLLIEGSGVGASIQLAVAPQAGDSTFVFSAEVFADELDPNTANDADAVEIDVQAAADVVFGNGFD